MRRVRDPHRVISWCAQPNQGILLGGLWPTRCIWRGVARRRGLLGRGCPPSGPSSVLVLERSRPLSMTSSPESLLLRLRTEAHLPRLRGSTRAARATGATPAVGGSELDMDHVVAMPIVRWTPLDAGVPLGAGHFVRRPVDGEGTQLEASGLTRLPGRVTHNGSEQVDVILTPAGHQQV
jgi:hypothetical protein